jgi:hypothetical protein
MPQVIGSYETAIGHPGIFIGQTRVNGLKNHVDIPYVTSLAPKNSYDFGVLDLWALKQRTDSPLLTMSVENAQVVYTDADYYTFELPSAADGTTRIVSGGLDRSKFGMDGEEFPIVITRRDFGPGAIISFDLTSKISFTVVNRMPEQMGEHHKIWVTLNTNDEVKYVTKGEFVEGRQLIKLADTTSTDFAGNKSIWSVSGVPSMAKYKNYLSNATLQQSYRFTTGAVEYLNSATRFDARQVQQLRDIAYQFYAVKGIADNKVINMGDAAAQKQYMPLIEETQKQGMGAKTMISFFDSIAVDMMLSQNNTLMIWGPGINQLKDGYDTTRLVPGMWFQLDKSGYKHGYSIETFSLNTISNAIKDFEFGKTALKDRDATQRYRIRTGKGGQELIWNAFLEKGLQVPAVVNNADHGFLTGQANNLSYRLPVIKDYQIPNIGILTVDYDPGLDPVKADEFINPILPSGYRLSSYTMIIEDYDTASDNVVILRKGGDGGKIKMIVENGTETHPFFQGNYNVNGQNVSIHNGSDELTGFQVKFKGKADTLVVKDPTKLLKLVPKNPRTGLYAL